MEVLEPNVIKEKLLPKVNDWKTPLIPKREERLHVGIWSIPPISSGRMQYFVEAPDYIQVSLPSGILQLSHTLYSIIEEIEHSRYIPELSESWNGDDAKTIKYEIWENSVRFLANYATFIYDKYSIVIDAPEINPVPDGSIDLSWRTSKARMLINIREKSREIVANFYGDFYENTEPRKGSVPIATIKEDLAVWMKNLV